MNGGVEVRVEGLVKAWGEARAVDGIAFTAEPGSFTVLLGPSGCGKSTTLRLIAGLETATAGRILIGGRDVTGLPPAVRRISMVFQSYALFPHLSVAENILFGLKVRRVPKADRAARLERVAAMLGLDRLLERRPAQLSGGQQQRVALGRAVIAETAVCLMDEPLSNLDAKLRQEMRQELRALQRKLGITMLYVTHDQTEAMSMADRIILLRDGRIEQNDTPEAIYMRPASVFVARFVGTPPMNVLMRTPPAGGGLAVGIRPENITLSDRTGLPVRVTAIEYLGADTVIACDASGESLLVRAPGHACFAPGDSLRMTWAPDSVHLFDAATGRRRAEPTTTRTADAAVRS